MRIVTGMSKTASLLAIFLFSTAPLLAQVSQVGILIGGSKRLVRHSDEAASLGIRDNFSFRNSVREIYYAVQLDPGTFFKVKAGQIEAPVALRYTTAGGPARTDVQKGKVEHVDGIIDYRFSEPFGSTGLFAGVGLYRQSGTITSDAVPADQRGQQTEMNFGLSGGVVSDFPITRRTGFLAEVAYHWVNYRYKARYLTLSGGFRFSF
jgi:hypothetical protein